MNYTKDLKTIASDFNELVFLRFYNPIYKHSKKLFQSIRDLYISERLSVHVPVKNCKVFLKKKMIFSKNKD